MFVSIDKTVDKLERQVRKYKTRLKKRYQNNETIRFDDFDKEPAQKEEDKDIKKRKTFTLRPMHEDEAILQMELLNHNFFIFKNAENDKIEVSYKRSDGDYGIIEVDG